MRSTFTSASTEHSNVSCWGVKSRASRIMRALLQHWVHHSVRSVVDTSRASVSFCLPHPLSHTLVPLKGTWGGPAKIRVYVRRCCAKGTMGSGVGGNGGNRGTQVAQADEARETPGRVKQIAAVIWKRKLIWLLRWNKCCAGGAPKEVEGQVAGGKEGGVSVGLTWQTATPWLALPRYAGVAQVWRVACGALRWVRKTTSLNKFN